MKYFIYLILALAIILIAYNITLIDFNNVLGDESIVPVSTVLAGLCSILILLILLVSKKISKKVHGK
ncbi:MAG: hypothetical protein ACWA5P_01155 [bacterium]